MTKKLENKLLELEEYYANNEGKCEWLIRKGGQVEELLTKDQEYQRRIGAISAIKKISIYLQNKNG